MHQKKEDSKKYEKLKVKVSDEFDSEFTVELEDHPTGYLEYLKLKAESFIERTRSRIAYIGLGGTAVFLTGASALGFYDGTFDELNNVWIAAGPFAGWVFGHYFGGPGDKNGKGKDDE